MQLDGLRWLRSLNGNWKHWAEYSQNGGPQTHSSSSARLKAKKATTKNIESSTQRMEVAMGIEHRDPPKPSNARIQTFKLKLRRSGSPLSLRCGQRSCHAALDEQPHRQRRGRLLAGLPAFRANFYRSLGPLKGTTGLLPAIRFAF